VLRNCYNLAGSNFSFFHLPVFPLCWPVFQNRPKSARIASCWPALARGERQPRARQRRQRRQPESPGDASAPQRRARYPGSATEAPTETRERDREARPYREAGKPQRGHREAQRRIAWHRWARLAVILAIDRRQRRRERQREARPYRDKRQRERRDREAQRAPEAGAPILEE
jgi:hypothetical protein